MGLTVNGAALDDAQKSDVRDGLGLGTAATLDYGTAAGNLVQLDPITGELPVSSTLSVTDTVTDNATLTSTKTVVPTAFTAIGKAVTLPDATSLTPAFPFFVIDNSKGAYPAGVRDNAGKLLGAVSPGNMVIIALANGGTTAGSWSLIGDDIEAGQIQAEASLSTIVAVSAFSVWLTSTLLVKFGTIASGFAAWVCDFANKQFSAATTISATANDVVYAAYRVSSTTLIVFYGSSSAGTANRCVVVNLTGAAGSYGLNPNTVQTLTTSASITAWGGDTGGRSQAPSVAQLSDTLYLYAYPDTDTQAVAISVSGVDITIGSPQSQGAGITPNTANRHAVYPLSATKGLVVYNDNSNNNIRFGVVTVTGTACAWSANTSAATVSTHVPPVVFLTASKWVLLAQDASLVIRAVAASYDGSSTITVGAAASLETSGNGPNVSAASRYVPRLKAISATQAVAHYTASGPPGVRGAVITENGSLGLTSVVTNGIGGPTYNQSATPIYFGADEIIFQADLSTNGYSRGFFGVSLTGGTWEVGSPCFAMETTSSASSYRASNDNTLVSGASAGELAMTVLTGKGRAARRKGLIKGIGQAARGQTRFGLEGTGNLAAVTYQTAGAAGVKIHMVEVAA